MTLMGNAVGQLLAPIGTVKTSIFILGMATTVIAPSAFALGERPPTPSKHHVPNFLSLVTHHLSLPYEYDSSQSRFLGAALLISGIVAALITAPLLDRVLSHHLALTVKLVVPGLAGCWLGIIWAVTPPRKAFGISTDTMHKSTMGTHGLGASYDLLAIIGVCSFTLLPVTLELGCEVTRNAELSGAMSWLAANAVSLFLVLISDLLEAGPSANPPYNLKKQLILHAAFAVSNIPLVLCMKGKQVRREMDEEEVKRGEQES
ncbi:hypothetical protein FRB90_008661 [Tulasnella sp. 427]|nr:hypothetical protein FRB90_008661 [Tulasnella sp. 427]